MNIELQRMMTRKGKDRRIVNQVLKSSRKGKRVYCRSIDKNFDNI